ncbi:tripartite tricarboxylate transporter substrate binding protein [Craurococcus roseus]|uniref:Tripartite tricarboxylate transporter substrate binding protein n=1 Tax=Craurococcus roseus TaxID=77585 RepID=A0ABN1F6U9_9PROT
MHRRRMPKLALALTALAAAAAAPAATAQWAPDRPARILVGFAAGGTGDLVARTVAEVAAPRLGQPVVVENRAGANGMIAAEAAARAAPDGLTMLLCPTGNMTILPELPGARLPVDVRTELVPVANVALSTYGMVVGAAAPWRTVAEFVEAAKARPGALSFASVGTGSAQHLAGERLKRAAGVELLHVAYRGASLAAVDLIARRADAMITNLGDVARQVQGGELRLLALGDAAGHPLFPDAPKLGDTLPGLEVTSWLGICGPRGLPPETVAAWSRAILDGLAEPAIARRLADNGLRPLPEGPEAFAARMARDRAAWGEVIRAAGIKTE